MSLIYSGLKMKEKYGNRKISMREFIEFCGKSDIDWYTEVKNCYYENDGSFIIEMERGGPADTIEEQARIFVRQKEIDANVSVSQTRGIAVIKIK